MKHPSTKKIITLKSIQRELKAILENDISKLTSPQFVNNQNAAFMQFIAVQ